MALAEEDVYGRGRQAVRGDTGVRSKAVTRHLSQYITPSYVVDIIKLIHCTLRTGHRGALLPVRAGCGDARVGPPCPTTLCVYWAGFLGIVGLAPYCVNSRSEENFTEYVHFWSLEYGVFHGIRGIRVEYGRIQASGRSFGIRGKHTHTLTHVENVFTQ